MNELLSKKVKIVATIGPASESRETLLKLANSGVNVFRLNLSHRTAEEATATYHAIRAVEKIIGRPLTIMGDLAGPKIRIGSLSEATTLVPGQKIEIMSGNFEGTAKRVSLNFPEIIQSLEKGREVYIGDGDIQLRVEKKIPNGVVAKVLVGGLLKSRKGFSAQGLALSQFKLSAKDKADIKTMVKLGADAIAISFVQSKKDVQAVLNLLPKEKPPLIIAKIETQAGVANAEEILSVAGGIMVARGDLGLAVPLAELPQIQKSLIRKALAVAKPVITATHMLESMRFNAMPTRAEVTDVSAAVLDGSDAVMLSAETAMGKFPVEAVQIMSSIINTTTPEVISREFRQLGGVTDAVSASVVKIADQVGAKLIVVFTNSGWSARQISRHRHSQPIIALSPHQHTIHKLNFSYGVTGLAAEEINDVDTLIEVAKKIAVSNPVLKLKKGDYFVISAGVPFGKSGSTNLALVQQV
jgi:pyruvate kinase